MAQAPRFSGDPDQDPDPEIFKGFLMKFLEHRARPKEQSIRFWWRSDHELDPGLLNPDRDPDPWILKRTLYLLL